MFLVDVFLFKDTRLYEIALVAIAFGSCGLLKIFGLEAKLGLDPMRLIELTSVLCIMAEGTYGFSDNPLFASFVLLFS